MSYVFVVNNILLKERFISAEEISGKLLQNKYWVFNYNTPNLKRIRPGDKAVIYLAGKNNMFFYATFEIESNICELPTVPFDFFDELQQFFPLSCSIKNIKIFSIPVYAKEIKEKLKFISDKKNWGLSFRQSARIIGDDDFNIICK